MADSNVPEQISTQLGKIFRHMLPGLAVLCAAGASHPSWFRCRFSAAPWNLAVFATIALLAGNIWYVFHRYSIHQLIDWWMHRKTEGGYVAWLAGHIYRSHRFGKDDKRVHEHIALRSAQVIFIFVVSEIALAFSYNPEYGTFFEKYPWQIIGGALFGLTVGLVQYVISNKVDVEVVGRYS